MGTSNAERQKAFRLRHMKDVEGQGSRLDVVVYGRTHITLKRLAKHYGVSLAALLDRLAETEQRAIVDGMTSDQQREYFDSVTG